MFDFARETNFDEKTLGIKSIRDKTLIKLFISPAIIQGFLRKNLFQNLSKQKSAFYPLILMNFEID